MLWKIKSIEEWRDYNNNLPGEWNNGTVVRLEKELARQGRRLGVIDRVPPEDIEMYSPSAPQGTKEPETTQKEEAGMDYDSMSWNELRSIASGLGMYEVGDTKERVIRKLKDADQER